MSFGRTWPGLAKTGVAQTGPSAAQLQIQLAPCDKVSSARAYRLPPHPANSNKSQTHVSARNLCASTLKTDSLAAAATEINLQRFISARLLLKMEKPNTLSPFGCCFYLEGCINFVQATFGTASIAARLKTNISPRDLAVLACTLRSTAILMMFCCLRSALGSLAKVTHRGFEYCGAGEILLVSVTLSIPSRQQNPLPLGENFSAELHQSRKMIMGSKKVSVTMIVLKFCD